MKEDSKELALKYKTKKIIDLACPVQICAARFSPCGNVLAAACFDGSVRRWDSSTDKFTELTPSPAIMVGCKRLHFILPTRFCTLQILGVN